MLLGACDFGVVKPFLSYGRSKADNSTNEAKTMQLGASSPAEATGRVLVGLVSTKLSQTGVKRTTATPGYDYNLFRRTDAYAMLMNDRITNKSTGNSFGLGVRHRF